MLVEFTLVESQKRVAVNSDMVSIVEEGVLHTFYSYVNGTSTMTDDEVDEADDSDTDTPSTPPKFRGEKKQVVCTRIKNRFSTIYVSESYEDVVKGLGMAISPRAETIMNV